MTVAHAEFLVFDSLTPNAKHLTVTWTEWPTFDCPSFHDVDIGHILYITLRVPCRPLYYAKISHLSSFGYGGHGHGGHGHGYGHGHGGHHGHHGGYGGHGHKGHHGGHYGHGHHGHNGHHGYGGHHGHGGHGYVKGHVHKYGYSYLHKNCK